MARRSLAFSPPPALPIAPGDLVPDPGGPGASAWSTIVHAGIVWTGAVWERADTASAATQHVHAQGVPADTWVVTHGLGKVPAVTIVDSAGDEVRGDIRHDSLTQTTLRFAYPFSGTAYFN